MSKRSFVLESFESLIDSHGNYKETDINKIQNWKRESLLNFFEWNKIARW